MKNKNMVIIIIAIVCLLMVAVFGAIFVRGSIKNSTSGTVGTNAYNEAEYQKALNLYEKEEYQQAREIFIKLGDYKDSKHYTEITRPLMTASNYDGGTTLYEYDSEGRCIRIKFKDYQDADVVHNLQYDNDGRLIRSEYMITAGFGSGLVETEEYFYDSKGLCNRSEKICDVVNGSGSKSVTQRIHNSDGLLDSEIISYDSGSVVKKYKYDAAGRRSEMEINSNDEDRTVLSEVAYVYDADGNCIKEDHTEYEHGELYDFTVDNQYDENGNCVYSKTSYPGYHYEYTYTYAADGSLSRMDVLTSDGIRSSSTYEYEYKKLEKAPDANLSEDNKEIIKNALSKVIGD